MIDLQVRDLSKTQDEVGYIDFVALTNPQWEMIKANIDLLKNHEKCELMFVEDYQKILTKERTDAIDECIKTIIDYCGGLPNGMYVNALKKLKEQKND